MSVASVGMGARTAFQMLFDAVKSAQEENRMFKQRLGDIKSTLDSLQPLIQEIEKYNSKEELEFFAVQMEEGADLVQKWSKVSVWRKYKYAQKLRQLEKYLRRVFDVLKLQEVRDARETLVSLRNLEMTCSRIEKNLGMKSNQPETVKCSSAVPEPPSVTVGLDLPLRELKMKLLKDDKVSYFCKFFLILVLVFVVKNQGMSVAGGLMKDSSLSARNIESTNGLYNSSSSRLVTQGIGSQDVNDEVYEYRHEMRATSSEWIPLLTNLGLEILSAAFDQVSSPRKPHYALIGMLLAIVAMLACIWELVHNGRKEGVVLSRRRKLWCFYYPSPSNMLYGTFPEIFGLLLAIVQCICSAVQYYYLCRHATNPIKLSPVPVVFVFCLVGLKLLKHQRYTVDDTPDPCALV